MKSKRQNVESSKRQSEALQRDVRRTRSENTPEDLDVVALGPFDVSSSPDFTRRVMGRLGYMRVSQTSGRRDRIRRWGNRAGVLLAVAIAIGLAQNFYENSDNVRRPASLTIPTAIGNDVRHQQQRFENVIRSIRSVVPAQPTSMPIAPQPVGPEPQEIEGDFDESPTSPFRWV